jgi:DNA-binding winged helix-turn-helix (wHTH) protein/TolB-like protein
VRLCKFAGFFLHIFWSRAVTTDSLVSFRFGEFTVIPRERLLLRAGQPVSLTGKAFDLLVVLARSNGRLVGKDELLREVWPGVVVEEVNLTVNISVLRKVLGAAPDGKGWIETVARRGYRFRAPLAIVEIPVAELVRQLSFPASVTVAPQPPTDVGGKTETAYAATPGTAFAPSTQAGAGNGVRLLRIGLAGIALVAFVVLAAVLAWRERAPSTTSGFASVAVLPFSTDAGDDYVADGITEGLINSLTLIRDLRITPRMSAFRYKNSNVEPGKAGLDLHAEAIVTGKIARIGDKMRVQVDLVDVVRESQVWGATYEGDPAELVELQERIVQDLARRLKPALTQEDKQNLAYRATDNADAYRSYLEARYSWNQRSADGLRKAIELFQRSVQLDPNFAMAYSGLADSYATLGYLSEIAPREAFPVAKRYALKALQLDDSLAEAHASLAYIKFYFEWDWPGADAEFKRAIALNPRHPVTHQWYSVYLLAIGRANEGLREIRLAQEYDPLSLAINTDVGFHYYYTRQYAEAVKQLQAVLNMQHGFALAHLWLGRTYQQLQRYDEALSEYRQAQAVFGDWPVLVAARGSVEAMAGRTHDARETAAELVSLSQSRFVTSYGVALIYAGLNEKEAAFRWLERAFVERSHWLVWLELDPRWGNLRDDPRFAVLVRQMRFPARLAA